MRHRRRARKLGRTSAHRKAMYRNMVTALLEHERIQTTDPKAKELRRVADRMITLGKRGDLHARRQALSVIRSKEVTAKLFDDLAARYRDRPGGYTRVMKLGSRVGDAAPVSIVELVDRGEAGAPTPESEAPKKTRGRRAKPEAEEKQKSARRGRRAAQSDEAAEPAKPKRGGSRARTGASASQAGTAKGQATRARGGRTAKGGKKGD